MGRLKSYTNIWKVEKVLYGISDIKLPFALTFSQLGWLVGTELLVIFILKKIPPLCYSDNILFKYVVLPVGVMWFMSKKTFDGKKPYSFVKSVMSYICRPKVTYAGKKVNFEKHKFDEEITIVRCEKYVSSEGVPDQVY